MRSSRGIDVNSLENTMPAGFTLSPNAELMDEGVSEFPDCATYNHGIIPWGITILLVSGDHHE